MTNALLRTFQYQYLGTYTTEYQYLGERFENECREVYLYNETLDQFIDVDLEWFNQRKIVIREKNENKGGDENGTEDR